MKVHKDHAARKGRDGIGEALLPSPFVGGLETQARDGANVALDDMGEEWVGHLRLVGEVRGLVCHAQTFVWWLSLRRGGRVQSQYTAHMHSLSSLCSMP